MYFTNTQNDRQIEKLMTLKPNFKPRGYGIIVCMTCEVVCAQTCKELIKNALSNIRIPAFRQRLNQYLKESEGNLMNFKGTSHESIFLQELAKRKNPTSPILCALYLLTADDRLWAKVKHHVEGNSGPFVTLAKQEYSNGHNANLQKWQHYIVGDYNKQQIFSTALSWIVKSNDRKIIRSYMSSHRYDTNIDAMKTYFDTVIDWITTTFVDVENEMRGLEWGRLFETYHSTPYNSSEISAKVHSLYADGSVKKRAGVFEYILGGCVDTRLLEIRIFEDSTKKAKYTQQTDEAKKCDKSNCPLCALGSDNNKKRLWKFSEMDADHVTAWSKGGATDISNCTILCKTHNRAKGNK